MDFIEVGYANLKEVVERPATVFIHAKGKLLESTLAGRFDLINMIADIGQEGGYLCCAVTQNDYAQELLADPRHIHIFMNDDICYGTNSFCCIPGYLRGFWYFDELASRNNSSIRLQKFRPGPIKAEIADRFLQRLKQKFIIGNLSKYPQKTDVDFFVEPGCISLFMQDFKSPKLFKNYVGAIELIESSIAARGERHLYIKPHPLQKTAEREQILRYHDPRNGVTICDYGIHGLLAQSDLVISQTSAVGVEAYIHETPVILAGQTDFHHIAIVLTDADKMHEAMEAALATPREYAKYLYWFLKLNLIEPMQKKNAKLRILQILQQKGFAFGSEKRRGYF